MSLSQPLLLWMVQNAFYLVVAISLVVLAYILCTVSFQRRIFPALLERRVTKVITTSTWESPANRVAAPANRVAAEEENVP